MTIKSNQAIHEEVERARYLTERKQVIRQDGAACHNLSCVNFDNKVSSSPESYQRFGKTSKGHQRYRCRECLTTFTADSDKRRSHPDSKSHLNTTLFRLIVNDMSINRMMEITELSAPTIYRKIDMFYERCISFTQSREAQLRQMPLGFMRLSTDRQEYRVNWTDRKDKKNVVINAIGTADKSSRYVFGMDVNYDPSVVLDDILTDEQYVVDQNLKDYNRQNARLWLPYEHALGKQLSKEVENKRNELIKYYSSVPLPISEISLGYFIEELAEDYGVEALDQLTATNLPNKGAQVHSEYTMYAHFIHLERLIGHASGLRFYLDQEPAIERACNIAFSSQIKRRNLQSLYVKINKLLNVDQRRVLVNTTQKLLLKIQEEHGVDEREASKIVALHSLKEPVAKSGERQTWFELPIHKIYECEKHVCFLTPTDRLTETDKAMILLDASLHPIDNFFQIVRRRLSALERPISTSSNAGRVWTGKSPYNPEMIGKQLQILRTFYNYCYVSKHDKKTAAQRLGLAKGCVEIRKILYP
ncbi:hypothetical protein [Vibrio sp. B1FLJ16]|uniref:IS1/IS1595 family N-terminal zinc-binding domain-containing protein n=2 Tax=Vibrio sp. B1FLJ16 TaxID=2751178 RepID=UPI001C715F49|nr:hypothetical protein [Vibrio sp. B1FLJ16]